MRVVTAVSKAMQAVDMRYADQGTNGHGQSQATWALQMQQSHALSTDKTHTRCEEVTRR